MTEYDKCVFVLDGGLGFNKAIEMAKDKLGEIKIIMKKRIKCIDCLEIIREGEEPEEIGVCPKCFKRRVIKKWPDYEKRSEDDELAAYSREMRKYKEGPFYKC